MKRCFILLATILTFGLCQAREVDPLFGDTIDRTAEDFVIASLCIADPTNWTDDVLGIKGHAFIRLQCPVFNMDYCFSYESERINGQLIKYWLGKLKMGMFAIPTDEYLEDYRKWNRGVHEYALNIAPAAKQRLWQILDEHVMEGSELVLDLEERGCALTAAQYIMAAIKPVSIIYGVPRTKYTLCVPAQLAESWQNATVNGKVLLTYKGDLVEAPAPTWWDIYGIPFHK